MTLMCRPGRRHAAILAYLCIGCCMRTRSAKAACKRSASAARLPHQQSHNQLLAAPAATRLPVMVLCCCCMDTPLWLPIPACDAMLTTMFPCCADITCESVSGTSKQPAEDGGEATEVETTGFMLTFTFKENPYFTNTVSFVWPAGCLGALAGLWAPMRCREGLT